MISFLLFILPLLLITYLLQQRYSRGLNKFPGPFLASFTNVWKVWYAYNTSQQPAYVDIHKKYGNVVRIGPNHLSFADSRALQDIYGTKGGNQKSDMYLITAPARNGEVITGLLSSTNAAWHDTQRRALSSAFNLSQMIEYEDWITDTVALFMQQMRERFVDREGEKSVVDLPNWFAWFAADVISMLTFGQRTGFLDSGEDVKGTIAGVRWLFAPWLYFSRMPILDKLTLKNPILLWIQRRGFLRPHVQLAQNVQTQFAARKLQYMNSKDRPRQPGSKEPSDRTTLLDKFLIAEEQNGELGISPYSHSHTMVAAGSDTTAITLTALFYFLLKNPQCYRKLQAEVDATPIPNDSEVIPYSVAKSMPYLNACVNESFRSYSVTRIGHERVVPAGGLEIAGHFVPAGTDVGCYGSVIHRDPEVFGEDVEAYRPERWLESEEKVRKMGNSLLTFSLGKYSCLGKNLAKMEIVKMVPSLMGAFEIELVDPNREWYLTPGAFPIPKGVDVRLKSRTVT